VSVSGINDIDSCISLLRDAHRRLREVLDEITEISQRLKDAADAEFRKLDDRQ
jgi:hypothetical protein